MASLLLTMSNVDCVLERMRESERKRIVSKCYTGEYVGR